MKVMTDKQLKANKENAKKGGIKTTQGKEKVKYNAIKHGLSSVEYDEELEKQLLDEYNITGTLQQMLVRNTYISKSRYEKGVELEQKLFKHIIKPPTYEKVYKSQEEYKDYIEIKRRFENYNSDSLVAKEPEYTIEKVEGNEFNHDFEKIEYLISSIGKYNYQNETRLNKNISSLLQITVSN